VLDRGSGSHLSLAGAGGEGYLSSETGNRA